LSRWHIINEYQNQNISVFFLIKNDGITVEGSIEEIDVCMGLWEKSIKIWATELFSKHGLDKIINKWHCDYSRNMNGFVTYLQEETNFRVETVRVETVIEPSAPQNLLDDHTVMFPENETESSDNSNKNSDDEGKNKGQGAKDDEAAGDLCGKKKLTRLSARLKTVKEPGTPHNLCGKTQSTRMKVLIEKGCGG
jgi:hypothetical protein